MKTEDIIKQSKMAYKQWSHQWKENAKIHKDYDMRSFEDFRNHGIGKAAVLVANGYSFEENIETLKKYAHNVDIICCDKTLGHLLDNGITPQICVVCDANVSYEKYMEKYKDKLANTILFQNVCGNPKWTKNGNWQSVYFYVNKDVMNYEKEFMALSGCKNEVTAGTNVSNMMVVLITQCTNERHQNLFAYDKIILVGFDYSWRDSGKYYAFDNDGGGKRYYMRHVYGISANGNIVYTSNNLQSSASWLQLYLKAFKIKALQVNKDAIHLFGGFTDLEKQMQYRHKPSDKGRVKNLIKDKHSLESELAKINNSIRAIAKDHFFASESI